jgi:hypothetical protein
MTLNVGADLPPQARAQLSEAQADLDQHVMSCVNGMCAVCRVPAPCPPRRAASAVFARWHHLPHRVAGASHPEALDHPRPWAWASRTQAA